MNYIITAISSLTVGLVIFIITRWYDKREKKKSALEIIKEELIRINTLVEGHGAFKETVLRHENEIEYRKGVCESNHRWDGQERRRVAT